MDAKGKKEKKSRQAELLRIVSQGAVQTQEDLRRRLAEAGFDAAQATISRDMRELKINKGLSPDGVNSYYAGGATGEARYNSIFAQSVVSVDYAGNTVVIHCHAGMAQSACRVIDDQGFAFVVGTIAGDDTVFVLTRSESHAVRLIEQLNGLTRR